MYLNENQLNDVQAFEVEVKESKQLSENLDCSPSLMVPF